MGPIAIIDSGAGGLRVASALRQRLPGVPVLYFADTAREPYGGRSEETLRGWLEQIVQVLRGFQPAHIVLACNTAAAAALHHLRVEHPDLSFSGPVEPTARAALSAAGNKHYPILGVVGTEATIRSRIYEKAIMRRRSHARLMLRPCPLLVPMVQEGRSPDDPLVQLAVQQYVAPLQQRGMDVLVLGCTHYGLLLPAFRKVVGTDLPVIDSADVCAEDVALRAGGKLIDASFPGVPEPLRCIVTDDPTRFADMASRQLGERLAEPMLITPDQLEADRPAVALRRAAG